MTVTVCSNGVFRQEPANRLRNVFERQIIVWSLPNTYSMSQIWQIKLLTRTEPMAGAWATEAVLDCGGWSLSSGKGLSKWMWYFISPVNLNAWNIREIVKTHSMKCTSREAKVDLRFIAHITNNHFIFAGFEKCCSLCQLLFSSFFRVSLKTNCNLFFFPFFCSSFETARVIQYV